MNQCGKTYKGGSETIERQFESTFAWSLDIDELSRALLPEPRVEIFHVVQHLVGADLGNQRQDLVGLARRHRNILFRSRFPAAGLDDDRSHRLREVDFGDTPNRSALIRVRLLGRDREGS